MKKTEQEKVDIATSTILKYLHKIEDEQLDQISFIIWTEQQERRKGDEYFGD
jgi:hypothetical protein